MATRSDWFHPIDADGKMFLLEIFGVNRAKNTKHCMRLLSHKMDGRELEVFHLDDFERVKKKYNIVCLYINGKYYPPTKTTMLQHSTQLRDEGLGVVRRPTASLMEMVRRRRQEAR